MLSKPEKLSEADRLLMLDMYKELISKSMDLPSRFWPPNISINPKSKFAAGGMDIFSGTLDGNPCSICCPDIATYTSPYGTLWEEAQVFYVFT